ncbi:MAG: flagellar basal body-associated protein FliL [Rhodobacteraceae bacterium]|nr:MAG: flagellar basal body-associated protein FliL [Paracoccaceae bacterium]
MIAKIVPLIFLLAGIGGGIGTAMFLSPPVDQQSGMETAPPEKPEGSDHETATDSGTEFVKMSNQFVIPVVENNSIAALVVISLSLETRPGISEEIYNREPKLRDAFLRTLFEHANMGGFKGAFFTRTETLDLLRTALREVAQEEMGPDILNVLIMDIIRQDT